MFANYSHGSTLQYNELIVIPAIVRQGLCLGAWISHIYVDHPSSLAGGREIWGLPKELAEFHLEDDEALRIAAYQEGRLLCALETGLPKGSVPFLGKMRAFGRCDRIPRLFRASTRSRLGFSSGVIEVPPGSPFASLGLSGRRTILHHRRVRMFVPAIG